MLREHRDPASFVRLAARATSAGRLPWDFVLGAVLDGADGIAHSAVGAAIEHLQPPLYVYAWFARRFAMLRRPADARAAVDRAWANSKPYGWVRYNDGGSRLVAAEAAIAIDGDMGRRRVCEVLVQDYLAEIRHPGSLLQDLDRLVALLFADPPFEAIWSEVAEHAGQLAEVAMSAVPEPPGPPSELEEVTAVLVDLAFDDLDHPVRELADAARRLLLDLLHDPENRPAIREGVTARLATCDDGELESTLALLCGALEVDASWTGRFADQVRRLAAGTPSAIVSTHAETLLACLNDEVPSRQRLLLPAIYTLRLPRTPMPDVGPTGKPHPGQPLNDTDDPVELAGSLQAPLAWLAEASSIPQRNLTSRLAALMPEIMLRARWDRAAEKRMQKDLESAGLRIAYRRPRTAVVRFAFGRVVQELADAGKVPWPIEGIEQWLFAFDPLVSTLDASARPGWIGPPDAALMNTWSNKEWVRRPEDCLADAPLRLRDGYLVLAERTEWVKMDHGRPTEVRATQVGPHGYSWSGREEPNDGFFLRFPHRALGAEYPMMWFPGARVSPFPVLEGGGWLRPEFLAFSPALAFSRGWSTSDDGLFAWDDKHGMRMVESLRWRDGNLLHHDRHRRDEVCGEGWIVVATPAGACDLEPLLRGWRRYLVAARTLDKGDEWPRPVVVRREQALGMCASLDPITPDLRK